jgi:hypothetical protein
MEIGENQTFSWPGVVTDFQALFRWYHGDGFTAQLKPNLMKWLKEEWMAHAGWFYSPFKKDVENNETAEREKGKGIRTDRKVFIKVVPGEVHRSIVSGWETGLPSTHFKDRIIIWWGDGLLN